MASARTCRSSTTCSGKEGGSVRALSARSTWPLDGATRLALRSRCCGAAPAMRRRGSMRMPSEGLWM
eukprot:5993703-Pyramimonas_sp.AAC.1